jgi:hypothetical protein
MNFRGTVACAYILCLSIYSNAQHSQTKNLILVTLDGMRWQELFQGGDPVIMNHKNYVRDHEVIQAFIEDSPRKRREALMPFMWSVIANEGQLYGNREYGNKVNCTNHHLISYPGYSEMLVGFRHKKVSSNRKVENPHATVFESIEKQRGFKDEVAAFATWDAFPFILRESRSDIHVNAGKEAARGNISDRERLLNQLQWDTGIRSDSMTFQYAMEYLKRERPRVIFIGFDETDQHAHAGRYGAYLAAAHRADQMIARLWEWVQSQPDYRDQTTLLITTDHGRGTGKNNWRQHRLLAAGSRHIWFAVIGPDTPAFGEMKIEATTYQNQVAKTIAAFLGLPYDNKEPVGDVVQTMITIPQERGDPAYSALESAASPN